MLRVLSSAVLSCRALACRALAVRIVAVVLLVSSLATTAAAAPSFSVTWEVVLEPGFQVALASQGVVFQVNQTRAVEGDRYAYNDTIIATTPNQSLWMLQSTGRINSNIAVYAFSPIPKLIFVLFNNMQQPNISAVIPSTGTVVWSTLCPFDVSYLPGSLMVSPDGSALYWWTSNANSTIGLTALDAEYGTVLWSEVIPNSDQNITQPLQCGPPHSNCLGIFAAGSTVVQFLDGRTRAVLAEVTLPAPAPLIVGLSQATPDVVLVQGDYEDVAINTTSFTVLSSWSVPDPGVGAQTLVQPMPPGSPTTFAVMELGDDCLVAVDLFTGSSLWTTDVNALCPCDSPGSGGCANAFGPTMFPQAPLGAEDLFVFQAQCQYNNQNINIYGLVNLTTGALVKSVDISYPPILFLPVGPGYFIGDKRFYDTNLTVFAWFPPNTMPCSTSAITVEGNTVMFTIWCNYEGFRVVAGVVRG